MCDSRSENNRVNVFDVAHISRQHKIARYVKAFGNMILERGWQNQTCNYGVAQTKCDVTLKKFAKTAGCY